jgi:hypothetical protein
MPEDLPNGDNGIPSTTNAQESMHRVYYMFRSVLDCFFSLLEMFSLQFVASIFFLSAGKKPLLLGMVELFDFVKALETDWRLVTRGTTIRYGSQAKKQIDISHSIEWKKPTKH